MGLLQNLQEKFIVAPVAKRLLDDLKAEKSDTPNIFQVPMGFNNSMAMQNKRMASNGIDFPVLRALSVNHDTTRAAINVRKRQITQLEYDIVDVDPNTEPDKNREQKNQIKELITQIGGKGVRFRNLLDKMIEDTLVIDGCVFYKQRTGRQKLVRIIPIDPSTIKVRVDATGGKPLPPEIAYEQWINGSKVGEFTIDELTYEIMNPRTNSPYGLSPIESLISDIDTSLRAGLYNSNYLSDNNVPAGFLSLPENWTVQQIKEYKEFFDAMLTGSKNTSKVFPIPGGSQYQPTTKPTDFSFAEFLDYLDRKVCMMFDVTPQELGLNLRQYKENADRQDKIQIRRGIKPLSNFLADIFTDIIQEDWGFKQFKFKFTGLDGRFSVEDVKNLVPIGVIGVDEARNDMGVGNIGVGNIVITGMGARNLEDDLEASEKEEEKTETEEKAPTEGEVQDSGKMAKRGSDPFFDLLMNKPKYKKFYNAVKKSIEDQIKPFASSKTINDVTGAKKADTDIEDLIDDILVSINIKGFEEYLKWAAMEGGQHALDSLNIDGTFSISNKKFIDLLGDRENYLINSVDDTTKDYLVRLISNAKNEGKTNEEVAQQIAEEIEGISSVRADMIAQTEVANAAMQSELLTYKDQGVQKKKWVTSADDAVCPICEPLDGLVADIDGDFEGFDAPPSHPRCRCYMQAVFD